MFCILNLLFYHPVSEATPDSKITGAYLTIGLDTDEELREGALHVLQLVRPDWPADSIRKAGISFSLVRNRGRGAAYARSSSS
jgi:hypothetical protein